MCHIVDAVEAAECKMPIPIYSTANQVIAKHAKDTLLFTSYWVPIKSREVKHLFSITLFQLTSLFY